MFKFFSSSKKNSPKTNELCADVAAELFAQIDTARAQAKEGGVVDERIFNGRLNSMFVAGYLIAYVDAYIGTLNVDEKDKNTYAGSIFETMFPGAGMKFVQAKLALRQQAAKLDKNHPEYEKIVRRCKAFDMGMEAGEGEATQKCAGESSCSPHQLKDYLLLGEV